VLEQMLQDASAYTGVLHIRVLGADTGHINNLIQTIVNHMFAVLGGQTLLE